MTLLNCGTCWTGELPLVRELQQRALYGKVYQDSSLEAKRRLAVEWLRTKSATGWCVDKVVRKI